MTTMGDLSVERYKELAKAWWTLRFTHLWEAYRVQQVLNQVGIPVQVYSDAECRWFRSGVMALARSAFRNLAGRVFGLG